jgi:hypothetical protein
MSFSFDCSKFCIKNQFNLFSLDFFDKVDFMNFLDPFRLIDFKLEFWAQGTGNFVNNFGDSLGGVSKPFPQQNLIKAFHYKISRAFDSRTNLEILFFIQSNFIQLSFFLSVNNFHFINLFLGDSFECRNNCSRLCVMHRFS